MLWQQHNSYFCHVLCGIMVCVIQLLQLIDAHALSCWSWFNHISASWSARLLKALSWVILQEWQPHFWPHFVFRMSLLRLAVWCQASCLLNIDLVCFFSHTLDRFGIFYPWFSIPVCLQPKPLDFGSIFGDLRELYRINPKLSVTSPPLQLSAQKKVLNFYDRSSERLFLSYIFEYH